MIAGFASSSFAGIITSGTFSIGGNVYVTDASGVTIAGIGTCAVGSQCIFWSSLALATPGKADISPVTLPDGDIPVGISGNDAGNISSLINPPEIVGVFPLTEFFSFNSAGITTNLLADEIFPGMDSAAQCLNPTVASGQTCSLPGSLFQFQNNAPVPPGQATATWSFEGQTDNPLGNIDWIGNFTAQFGIPYQTVFADLATNHYVTNSYSGTITLFTSTTPEPGTLGLMIGTALMGLGVSLRRLRAKK